MELFELFFEDLNEAAQARILDAYGVESPEEMNWDIFPITELVIESNYEDDEDNGDGDDY